MIQRAQHDPTPDRPLLTRDQLWYLDFLRFAEETAARGELPCHSRPLSLICRLQEELAAEGLVRYEGPREPIPHVVLTPSGRAIDPHALARRGQPGIDLGEVPEMEVCHACASVVGPFRDYGVRRVQRGRCRRHARPEGEPRWPGWDLQLRVELCRCCGRVPLRSGHRFSVWFCLFCSEQVGLLNGRHGRCIVPIGRHSVHAGHLLAGQDAADPIAVHTFVEAVSDVFQVHGILATWARTAVQRNLGAVGAGASAAIPLFDYWAAVRDRIDPGDRFREMCAFLEQAGREEQGRAGR